MTFRSVPVPVRRSQRTPELAARAGLHPITIYLLESGLRRPSTPSIWRIARALPPRGTCTLRDAVAVDQLLPEAATVVPTPTRASRT